MIDYRMIEPRIIAGTHKCRNCGSTCQRWQRGKYTYCSNCEPSVAIATHRADARRLDQHLTLCKSLGQDGSKIPLYIPREGILIPFTEEQKKANAA